MDVTKNYRKLQDKKAYNIMTDRMLHIATKLQAFSAENERGRKKSEECAVVYRQVPYCTIGVIIGNLVLPTYKHYKAFARYRFFGLHCRGRVCVPYKNEKAEAW